MSDAVTVPKKFTISSGQTTSTPVSIQGYTLIAVSIPSSWTTANLQFLGDIDGTENYKTIYKTDGTAVTWTVGAANTVICPVGSDALIGGLVNLKVVSTVAQGADREIIGHFIKTQR